jgi:CspA family cold shock protein
MYETRQMPWPTPAPPTITEPAHIEGKVMWFDANRGFGFIECEDGPDCYFRTSDCTGINATSLKGGEPVTFTTQKTGRNPHARNIRLAD